MALNPYDETGGVGGGGDWFDANAPTASTNPVDLIIQAYQQYLDRIPSQEEIQSHLGPGANVYASIENIKNSLEARNKAIEKAKAAQTTTAPPTDVAGTIQAILKKYPPTTAGLQQAMTEINAIYPNAKIVGSSGGDLDLTAYGVGIVDVLEGAASGGRAWHWNPDSAAGQTINPNLASYDPATFGQLRQPFSEVYAPKAWQGTTPYTGPQSTNVTPFSYDTYQTTPNFTNPTAADLYEDPSYAVRFAEGQKAVESSAAAKGSLMTGGTLKALEKYGQDQASKEYQNVYNRAANTWGINAAKNLAEYQTGFNSALAGWGANTGQANTQFGQQRDTWGLTSDAKYRDWLANYNAQQEGFKTRYGIYNDQRNFDFNNLYKLAMLGQSSV